MSRGFSIICRTFVNNLRKTLNLVFLSLCMISGKIDYEFIGILGFRDSQILRQNPGFSGGESIHFNAVKNRFILDRVQQEGEHLQK